MMTPAATTSTRTRPETTAVSTVALCQVDPAKFVMPPEGMRGVTGASLVTVYQCAEAIQAALNGDADVLVLDGNRIGLSGLNALSFLNQERPDIPIYLFHEEEGDSPRLIAWSTLM